MGNVGKPTGFSKSQWETAFFSGFPLRRHFPQGRIEGRLCVRSICYVCTFCAIAQTNPASSLAVATTAVVDRLPRSNISFEKRYCTEFKLSCKIIVIKNKGEVVNFFKNYRSKYENTDKSAYWDTIKGFLILLVVVGHFFYAWRSSGIVKYFVLGIYPGFRS